LIEIYFKTITNEVADKLHKLNSERKKDI